ncbi:MAG: glycerate kinase [Planctomycetaceae bacterium]|nr:glycerate kinase [Planctomycetaceae bacterium]
MSRTPQQLRDDLLAIWNAGVEGVRVDRLIRNTVSLHGDVLQIGDEQYLLNGIDRIIVIGGGKASGAMAETLESILEPLFDRKEVAGWVNVPEKSAKPLRKIFLHPARPMGMNEPTEAAVEGTNRILELAKNLKPNDLCLNLLSGGGSALLPAPVPEISLQEKLELTRFLSESGATIQELNTVRKQISRIKGGKLKSLCYGKRLISLILSDVLGDPLDVIASGPTVDNSSSISDALAVLRQFAPSIVEQVFNSDNSNSNNFNPKSITNTNEKILSVCQTALLRICRYFRQQILSVHPAPAMKEPHDGFVRNLIIGNLATAVDAAGTEALRRGYSYAMYVSRKSEGFAEEVGTHLVDLALMKHSDCLIHGGEPVVKLVSPEQRGKGGRNQQLVLAALLHLMNRLELETNPDSFPNIAILSGGTDGEDGPTDAAGAWIDPIFWSEFQKKIKTDPTFQPLTFLQHNNAYHFFEPLGTLLKTGTTGTNVCDLRVILVEHSINF